MLVVTCNRLWRGYRICQTSLAIKSSGRSFGILPLRISCVPILLGALAMLCCLLPSSAKFHRSNRVLAVSSFSLSLIKGEVSPTGMFCFIEPPLRVQCNFLLCFFDAEFVRDSNFCISRGNRLIDNSIVFCLSFF